MLNDKDAILTLAATLGLEKSQRLFFDGRWRIIGTHGYIIYDRAWWIIFPRVRSLEWQHYAKRLSPFCTIVRRPGGWGAFCMVFMPSTPKQIGKLKRSVGLLVHPTQGDRDMLLSRFRKEHPHDEAIDELLHE